jgi:hypothetical protein
VKQDLKFDPEKYLKQRLQELGLLIPVADGRAIYNNVEIIKMRIYTEQELNDQELGRAFWSRGCILCGGQVAAGRALKLIPNYPGALLDEYGIDSEDPVAVALPLCLDCMDADIKTLTDALKMEGSRNDGTIAAS